MTNNAGRNRRKTASGKKYSKPWSIFLIAVFSILIIASFVFKSKGGPVDTSNKAGIVVEIPQGASSSKIGEILKEKNLIKNETVFKYNVKFSRRAAEFKSGTYRFSQAMSNRQIIDKIADGKFFKDGEKITVPEGSTKYEIADILKKNGVIENQKDFLNVVDNAQLFADKFEFLNDGNIKSLEGFLYPETYFIKKGTPSKKIAETMLLEFRKNVKNTGLDLKGKDMYKTMIMASIVEKEAVGKTDMAKIASVFYNRLKINMPLQSDATIQYALPERKKIVTYNDLKIKSPYNSYTNKGLPPTPIANPGIDAIKAAVSPEKTDYLYFVAKIGGGNSFSKTYEEHLKHEKEYKKKRDELMKKDKSSEKDKKDSEKSGGKADEKDNM